MSRDVQPFASVHGRLAGMKVLTAHNYLGRLRAKPVLNSRPKHRAPECLFARVARIATQVVLSSGRHQGAVPALSPSKLRSICALFVCLRSLFMVLGVIRRPAGH
jgi:hypothetical protein